MFMTVLTDQMRTHISRKQKVQWTGHHWQSAMTTINRLEYFVTDPPTLEVIAFLTMIGAKVNNHTNVTLTFQQTIQSY